ncbi:MAG: hypothetical protein QOK05_1037 [Chloroflexota bacterium]|jgi:hypothetical protein|nr:hypothetical protein [Chloroflexota bacterium]
MDELRADLEAIQRRVVPVRAALDALAAEADGVRGEIRRRERAALVEARRGTRVRLAAGELPDLEMVVAADQPVDGTRFDNLAYLRESATEVRLGYASASHQEVSFTDGVTAVDAPDLGTARRLWRDGWEFGTVAIRGVRVYPVGSRAEKVVPPGEVHVRLPEAES